MIYDQYTTLDLPRKILCSQANGDCMRRILMVNNGSMLDEGVAKLLADREGLAVLSIDSFEGEEALIRCIESTYPEVIIINRESPFNLARLFGLIENIPNFRRLQIVTISVDSNTIYVHENQQVSELDSQDFFDFLQGAHIK